MPFGIYMPTDSELESCQAANDPWDGSAYYGYWATYFILAAFLAVSISSGIKRLHNLNRIMGVPSVLRFHPKISAFFRTMSYPQLRFWGGSIPPLGPSFLLFGFLLFSTLVCFLRRPYYRPPNFGSSPLGVRSDLIATAMVPWIYAAATKRNLLEYFSGVSLARLMTLHKWAPWICLYMSVLHTWAMVHPHRHEPWWYIIQSDECFWNGIPPLVALAWLCVMSLGPIRRRFYETFYVLHMLSAAVFLIWMYIHLADALQTWRYMHAATVLWGAGILWRGLAYAFDHGWFRRIPRASFEMLPSSAVRIRIPMPSNRTWSAGSYVYLRFLTIQPWQSHPFTISSVVASSTNGDPQVHEMVFVIRPHGGLTARVASLAASSPSSLHACLVDGPYGGFMDSLRACDMVLLIAGGTGMTALVPIAQALSRSSGVPGLSRCGAYEVHWAMRESTATTWFSDQLTEIGDGIQMYLTGQNGDNTKLAVDGVGGTKEQLDSDKDRSGLNAQFQPGRPNVTQLVRRAAEQYSGRIGVMVCGPPSMIQDVRDTVWQIEADMLRGAEGLVCCSEIELYEESFET